MAGTQFWAQAYVYGLLLRLEPKPSVAPDTATPPAKTEDKEKK